MTSPTSVMLRDQLFTGLHKPSWSTHELTVHDGDIYSSCCWGASDWLVIGAIGSVHLQLAVDREDSLGMQLHEVPDVQQSGARVIGIETLLHSVVALSGVVWRQEGVEGWAHVGQAHSEIGGEFPPNGATRDGQVTLDVHSE